MITEERTALTNGHTEDPARTRRRKGRPLEMSPDEVIRRIQLLGEQGSLFRVHREHPALYARARRQFGSWAGALARAGLDHAVAVTEARRRSVEARKTRDRWHDGR